MRLSHRVFMPPTLVASGCDWLLMIATASILVSGGCGPRNAGPQRFDVSGTVTFDGKPVPLGTVYFEADASRGNAGPVSIVGIEDGRYDSKAAKAAGPVQGPLSVRISGSPKLEPGAEPVRPLFPEYTTTIDLDPTVKPHVFDFDVPRPKR
jgi:hypothetical protein